MVVKHYYVQQIFMKHDGDGARSSLFCVINTRITLLACGYPMKTIDASIKLEKHKGQQLEILIYFFDLEPYENSYPDLT